MAQGGVQSTLAWLQQQWNAPYERMLQTHANACPAKRGNTYERAQRARKMRSHSDGDSKLAQCAGGNHHPSVSVPKTADGGKVG